MSKKTITKQQIVWRHMSADYRPSPNTEVLLLTRDGNIHMGYWNGEIFVIYNTPKFYPRIVAFNLWSPPEIL